MERIASRENERVKYACRLAASSSARAEEGALFAEGTKLCMDLASTLTAKAAFFTEKYLKANPAAALIAPEAYLISEPVNDKLAQTKTPQGLYCLFELPQNGPETLVYENGVLLCEALQDPTNVGAVLRSAAAFGFGGVMLLGCADPFSPRALRAGMGAVGRLPLAGNLSLAQAGEALRAKGVTLYAAALQNAKPLSEVKARHPFALMVGSEGAGLSEEALALAQQTVYIPMKNGVESLNAAVAASVLMFHFAAAGPGA